MGNAGAGWWSKMHFFFCKSMIDKEKISEGGGYDERGEFAG